MLDYILHKNSLAFTSDIIPLLIINLDTFDSNIPIINQCIELFNSQLEWDGMFDISEARRRVVGGDTMYVGIDDEVYSYLWVNDNPNHYFIYNVFSNNIRNNPNYTGKDLLYSVIKSHLLDKDCKCKIDEWNIKSINLFKKLGFNQTNI
jgi:RimJ/RimL family protein N-acetyltransferase